MIKWSDVNQDALIESAMDRCGVNPCSHEAVRDAYHVMRGVLPGNGHDAVLLALLAMVAVDKGHLLRGEAGYELPCSVDDIREDFGYGDDWEPFEDPDVNLRMKPDPEPEPPEPQYEVACATGEVDPRGEGPFSLSFAVALVERYDGHSYNCGPHFVRPFGS